MLLNQFTQQASARDWVVAEPELTASGDLLATLARLARQAVFELAPPGTVVTGRPPGRGGPGGHGDPVRHRRAECVPAHRQQRRERRRAGQRGPARDITDLLVTLASAAAETGRGVALMFDELQFAPVAPSGRWSPACTRSPNVTCR